MIVMKFGGTSVGSADAIRNVTELIREKLELEPVIVASAVGGVTDLLIKAAHKAEKGSIDINQIRERHEKVLAGLALPGNLVNKELDSLTRALESISQSLKLTPRMHDAVISHGERMSCRILSAFLCASGIQSRYIQAYDIGFVTDSCHTEAEVLSETYSGIREKFDYSGSTAVVTGFIAKNEAGDVTTLGRSGSDYTAAILGAALGASEIQIWTDVSGIRTTDPRIVSQTKTITEMSFAEASELAYFGGKVLHPKTIIPAITRDIPVRVLNTYSPGEAGTLIVSSRSNVKPGAVMAISCKKNIRIINMNSSRMLNAFGFLEKLFSVFARHNVVVDVVSTSEVSVSVTVENDDDTDELVEYLSRYANITVEEDNAIICVIGEGLKNHTSNAAARIFSCLSRNGIERIEMISQGASEINITFIVDSSVADLAIRQLHQEFFEMEA